MAAWTYRHKPVGVKPNSNDKLNTIVGKRVWIYGTIGKYIWKIAAKGVVSRQIEHKRTLCCNSQAIGQRAPAYTRRSADSGDTGRSAGHCVARSTVETMVDSATLRHDVIRIPYPLFLELLPPVCLDDHVHDPNERPSRCQHQWCLPGLYVSIKYVIHHIQRT